MHQDISQLYSIRNGTFRFPFVLQGSDEAGRGPLAGPVVACTVSIFVSSHETMAKVAELLLQWRDCGVNDSKKISSIKRKTILSGFGIQEFHFTPEEGGMGVRENTVYSFVAFNNVHVQFKIVSKAASYIDQNNILNASLSAMWESGADLNQKGTNGVWYIDGNCIPRMAHKNASASSLCLMGQRFDLIPIIKGDSKMLLIGLASIIAKEYRDFMMSRFASIYPQYGFERHAGYPTLAHLEALKRFGSSPIHRQTFKGVTCVPKGK